MDDKTYRETLERIGKHDAAMLVKWWLAAAQNHSRSVAPRAYPDLFTGHGLTPFRPRLRHRAHAPCGAGGG